MKTREELEAMSAEEFKEYINTEMDKFAKEMDEDWEQVTKIQKWTNRAWMIGMGILTVVAVITQRRCYRNGFNTGYTMGKNYGVMVGYKDAMKIMRWRS